MSIFSQSGSGTAVKICPGYSHGGRVNSYLFTRQPGALRFRQPAAGRISSYLPGRSF